METSNDELQLILLHPPALTITKYSSSLTDGTNQWHITGDGANCERVRLNHLLFVPESTPKHSIGRIQDSSNLNNLSQGTSSKIEGIEQQCWTENKGTLDDGNRLVSFSTYGTMSTDAGG